MPEAIPFQRPAPVRLERRRIINDTSIRSIKPPTRGTVDYFDEQTPGLSLRVTANDVRTWTVFYRDRNARQKRLTLGRYPAVKLVDARELARNAQRNVAHGGIPSSRSAPRVKYSPSASSLTSISRTTPSSTRRAGKRTSGSSSLICCPSGSHGRR